MHKFLDQLNLEDGICWEPSGEFTVVMDEWSL